MNSDGSLTFIIDARRSVYTIFTIGKVSHASPMCSHARPINEEKGDRKRTERISHFGTKLNITKKFIDRAHRIRGTGERSASTTLQFCRKQSNLRAREVAKIRMIRNRARERETKFFATDNNSTFGFSRRPRTSDNPFLSVAILIRIVVAKEPGREGEGKGGVRQRGAARVCFARIIGRKRNTHNRTASIK